MASFGLGCLPMEGHTPALSRSILMQAAGPRTLHMHGADDTT